MIGAQTGFLGSWDESVTAGGLLMAGIVYKRGGKTGKRSYASPLIEWSA
jgi:hypothetical protein